MTTRVEAPEDFESYVRARYAVLLRSAVLLTGEHHAGHDLVQDALVTLASRWDQVSEGSPDAYVRRCLYTGNVSRWRRTGRKTPVGELYDDARTVGPTRPVDPGDGVGAIDVRRALQQLTPKQRAVMVLRYYEDLSEAEIAETLGISQGTVERQAHLAARRLRQLLPGFAVAQSAGRGPRTGEKSND